MFEMKCETPAHEISVQTYIKTLDFYASPIKTRPPPSLSPYSYSWYTIFCYP